jgi:hypothetical protein
MAARRSREAEEGTVRTCRHPGQPRAVVSVRICARSKNPLQLCHFCADRRQEHTDCNVLFRPVR